MSALDGKPEVKVAKDSNENITLTRSDLQNIIAQAVAAATAAAQEKADSIVSKGMSELAAAIIESRKPYVDPKQLENEKNMREQMRVVNERMHQQILSSQALCPHLQGSNELSDFSGQLSSLVIHRLDNGVVVGICTNCQKHIFSNDKDPEVQKIFRMKSGNRMSSAGVRTFMDPKTAMEVGRLPER
jgi:type III secretion system FlhB-like substrate exporter